MLINMIAPEKSFQTTYFFCKGKLNFSYEIHARIAKICLYFCQHFLLLSLNEKIIKWNLSPSPSLFSKRPSYKFMTSSCMFKKKTIEVSEICFCHLDLKGLPKWKKVHSAFIFHNAIIVHYLGVFSKILTDFASFQELKFVEDIGECARCKTLFYIILYLKHPSLHCTLITWTENNILSLKKMNLYQLNLSAKLQMSFKNGIIKRTKI